MNVHPDYKKNIITTIPHQLYFVENGKAYIQSRMLGEVLNQSVSWDEESGQVIIGNKMFAPYKIENGKSYIGIREAVELLGYKANFDGETHQIIICVNS